MRPHAVVCITGMHRSGTSLFASWLKKCGLSIDDGAVVQHGAGNPRGLFEDRDFVNLHSAAILRIDPQSKGWIIHKQPPGHSFDFSEQERERALELVEIRNRKRSCWGWKDPRSVFFLEQWRQIVPELKVVFLWRPAADVVASLQRRTQKVANENPKIELAQAVQLWRQQNLLICRYARKYQADSVILPISDVFEDDREVFDHIDQKFQLDLSYTAVSEIFDAELFQQSALRTTTWLDAFNPDFLIELQLSRLSRR